MLTTLPFHGLHCMLKMTPWLGSIPCVQASAVGSLVTLLHLALPHWQESSPEQAAQPAGTSASASQLGAEARQLAIWRAHILTARKCGNPRCASLEGASEAAARGHKCSGCRLVRYCSRQCSVADWPQHKLCCKLLQQEAAGS